ncbi:DF family (seleno)protein [Actinotalea solisilvae]|uniref:DF family (seleno)protein n=1 Tax=Actinotalea solisilvae TaxID=2072922 RepID=UPI0018F22A93|nr:thioredoxin family protein [Actinotalea solisilvae]
MRVELLYFDGCPNWTIADQRLAEALRALGREDVTVERRLVQSAAEAEAIAFIGSPSIRVDGVDPFASGKEQVGLSCRLYMTPVGLRGSPTIDQLLTALS